jgi:hypothetical protein
MYHNVLIHLAAQLTAFFFELDLEVTEPILLPNGCSTCHRSPEAAFLRRPSTMYYTGFTNSTQKWTLSDSSFEFYQYSETNVMQFLFSSLTIKDLYMFRALLAHPHEALHSRFFVYCVCVMSVGCTRIGVDLVQPTYITRTQYTKCRCVTPPEDEQVILETYRGT